MIERCFSLLKIKWRRLKTYLHILNLSYATDIIIAACCLHNFVRNIDDWNEDLDQDDSDNSDEEDESDFSDSDDENEDIAAVLKRHSISLYYTPRGYEEEE